MFPFKSNKIITGIAVVCIVIFLGCITSCIRPFALPLSKYPFVFFSAVFDEVSGIILYHKNYVENRRIYRDVGLLQQRLVTLGELRLENARLRKLLAFTQEASLRVVPARVIGRGADNWSSAVIIDKGSRQGIKRGQVVLHYFGLAGRVVETSLTTSKVLFLNDANISVSALIQRSRQEGLVSGTMGNALMMRYLPQDVDIQPGDTIVTSGLTNVYPKGILIGTVVEIGEDLAGLSKYAMLKPALNFSGVEEVLVVVP